MTITVRPMRLDDWPAVAAIYEEGIATGDATFQPGAPPWSAWDGSHLPACRLAAVEDGGGPAAAIPIGWAALSAVSSRPVYAGVAEVSVYVAARARGHGVGR